MISPLSFPQKLGSAEIDTTGDSMTSIVTDPFVEQPLSSVTMSVYTFPIPDG